MDVLHYYVAGEGLNRCSHPEVPGRVACTGRGVVNMRVMTLRRCFWTRARRVSHVFQDSSILHMNEGLWHSWSLQIASVIISPCFSEPAGLVPLC